MKNLPPVKESEETEVKKNIKWLKEEIAIEMLQLERNRKERWSDVKYQTLRSVVQKIDQLDEPEVTLDKAFEKVAESYPMTKEEIYRHLERIVAHGKVTYGEQEVLSQEWIDDNTWNNHYVGKPFVYVEDLKNLLVPKQELPVIPRFVTEHIEKWKNTNVSLSYALSTLRDDLTHFRGSDEQTKMWLYHPDDGIENQELYARAWLDGYTVEKEPKYFAKIKGHENISSDDKYWNYCITDKSLDIGDNKVHADVLNEYVLNATKDEWANLGISDDNADFVEVEELEE